MGGAIGIPTFHGSSLAVIDMGGGEPHLMQCSPAFDIEFDLFIAQNTGSVIGEGVKIGNGNVLVDDRCGLRGCMHFRNLDIPKGCIAVQR